MIALGERPEGAWRPPIVKTVAHRGEGVDRARRRDRPSTAPGWSESGELERRRTRRARDEIEAIAVTALRARWGDVHAPRRARRPGRRGAWPGESDPYAAADALLENL